MKKTITVSSVATVGLLALLVGCAERKTRIWIEPPLGYDSQKASRNLVYRIEDPGTGKKESLLIPLTQAPQNLVVEDRTKNQGGVSEDEAATKADRALHAGKLVTNPDAGTKTPSVSYLRGLNQIQKMYEKKQFAEALIQLEPLIEQYPKQARLFTMQGTLYRKVGEKKMALLAFTKAHEIDPENMAVEETMRNLETEVGGSP